MILILEIFFTLKLSMFKLKEKPLVVYPNPSKGIMNLTGIASELIQVYEISGRKVSEQTIEKTPI
tara:strand:- start:63311 stop:63505 length:195 start_codon:yes stop_codon:yes gene_type:complete